jgi:hypothetical protein
MRVVEIRNVRNLHPSANSHNVHLHSDIVSYSEIHTDITYLRVPILPDCLIR